LGRSGEAEEEEGEEEEEDSRSCHYLSLIDE